MPAAASKGAHRSSDREEMIRDAEAVLADIDGAPDPDMWEDAFRSPACSTRRKRKGNTMDSQQQIDVVSEHVETETTVTVGRFGRIRKAVKRSFLMFGWTAMSPYDETSAQSIYAVQHGADIDDVLNGPKTGGQC